MGKSENIWQYLAILYVIRYHRRKGMLFQKFPCPFSQWRVLEELSHLKSFKLINVFCIACYQYHGSTICSLLDICYLLSRAFNKFGKRIHQTSKQANWYISHRSLNSPPPPLTSPIEIEKVLHQVEVLGARMLQELCSIIND